MKQDENEWLKPKKKKCNKTVNNNKKKMHKIAYYIFINRVVYLTLRESYTMKGFYKLAASQRCKTKQVQDESKAKKGQCLADP